MRWQAVYTKSGTYCRWCACATRSVCIAQVTIEARRILSPSSSDVLAKFDIQLCNSPAEESDGGEISICVMDELFDLDDEYLESPKTQDLMRQKVYNFIEYHRHVSQINRFYFYGYTNFTYEYGFKEV